MAKKPIQCENEYGLLKEVVVCEPTFMAIEEPINRTQRKYMNENINRNIASQQHQALVTAMEKEGIRVYSVPAYDDLPEQVFMRDSGFVIGTSLYVANLDRDIRKGEEKVLGEYLTKIGKPFAKASAGTVEGGDVVLANDEVYIGASGRTNKEGIEELRRLHPEKRIEMVSLDPDYLHLDCVFQPVSATLALIYRDALSKKAVDMLEQRFSLIDVSKEEQFHLGVNVLSIGNKRVIALPMNENTNAELQAHGFTIIEVDFSEIIKSGGSFRCVTMPLVRTN